MMFDIYKTSVFSKQKKNKSNNLDSLCWNFIGESTDGFLHGIHPYPAKFIPQIPRLAITEFTKKGDLVYDPFAGSGTTLLEASMLGRKSVGSDNNGVACLIAKAKTALYTSSDIKKLKSHLTLIERKINEVGKWGTPTTPSYKNFDYWFTKEAILDLGRLNTEINFLNGNPLILCQALFSSLIVRCSNQDSDTRYSRIQKEYKIGSAFTFYRRKLTNFLEEIESSSFNDREPSSVNLADSRKIDFIKDASVDLIVTSPPYLNAYDYHKYHRHRLEWIGADVAYARDNEIGKHDTFTRPKATPERYFNDMNACFTECYRILNKKAKMVVVVGDAIVSGRPVPVASIFCDSVQSIGFKVVSHKIREIRSDKKAFNLSNSRLKKEHVLIFEKV